MSIKMSLSEKMRNDFCQSKFYKDWNRDFLADYNSVQDRHLRQYFQQPGKKAALLKSKQMTTDGRPIPEKEWRRMNLEWERRRRDAREEDDRRRRREEEERKHRMELRQMAKQEEMERRKVEERRRKERESAAGLRDVMYNNTAPKLDPQEMKKIVDMINYEIEYVLRPTSAPSKKTSSAPKPKSAKQRTQSSTTRGRQQTSVNGYPKVAAPRSQSMHPLTAGAKYTTQSSSTTQKRPFSSGDKKIRNINVPDTSFGGQEARPKTAPTSSNREGNHTSVKPEKYQQSIVTLKYVGNPDHRARMRNPQVGKRGESPIVPAYLDEVQVVQQPRGTYTLEVFKGYLAVGDEFWFTSKRVENFAFSLTVFVNKQCHVRLSACCESKRTVGTRLGQGMFTLVSVEGAQPCIRCILEKDPVAQKHLAKMKKYRGHYDEWGNRISRTTLRLLEDSPEHAKPAAKKKKKKKQIQDSSSYELETPSEDFDYYRDHSPAVHFKCSDDDLSMLDNGPLLRRRKESQKAAEKEEKAKTKQSKMNYKDKLEVEHTYTAMRGDRHTLMKDKNKEKERNISPQVSVEISKTDNDYSESDLDRDNSKVDLDYYEEDFHEENLSVTPATEGRATVMEKNEYYLDQFEVEDSSQQQDQEVSEEVNESEEISVKETKTRHIEFSVEEEVVVEEYDNESFHEDVDSVRSTISSGSNTDYKVSEAEDLNN